MILAGSDRPRPSASRLLEIGPVIHRAAEAPLATIVLDGGIRGETHDLRPLLPLVIRR